MKKFFFICISLLVLIGTFSDAFVYITFKLNQERIASELCINLDEPELMCKGKCFLNDQLTKVNTPPKNEKGQVPIKFEKKDIPLYFKSEKSESISRSTFLDSTEMLTCVDATSYEKHLKGVFHPPQA